MVTTYPDGTTEEMTFSCPDDAANYSNQVRADGGMPNRISMNVTVPKQTQGATFGEKVNAGLQTNNIIHRDIAARNIISGTVTWTASGNPSSGIITNNTVRSGSLTMNSQNSQAKMSIPPAIKGIEVSIAAREHGSGMATGKRSREAGSGMATGRRSREAGSGMATGRRQYEPVFSDDGNTVCDPCLASVKSNPLYQDKGNNGTSPLYQGKQSGNDNGLCGKTGHLIAMLTNPNGEIVAKTNVEPCGDFWFANVPDGNYIVRISGELLLQKSYDVAIAGDKDVDIAGDISFPGDWMGVIMNTSGADEPQQKAGISTSRSNIRTKSFIIIDADTDGDGETETTKVLAELSDGTTKDITSDAIISKNNANRKKVTVRGWNPEKKESVTGKANGDTKQYEITIDRRRSQRCWWRIQS